MPGSAHANDIPERNPLDRPRSLTEAECALLARLVDHAGGGELADQARSARVVAVCSCGCPSIVLAAAGPPLPPEEMKRLEPEGRADWSYVTGRTRAPGGPEVEITLHILDGRVEELEIWSGHDGSGRHVDTLSADTLSFN